MLMIHGKITGVMNANAETQEFISLDDLKNREYDKKLRRRDAYE